MTTKRTTVAELWEQEAGAATRRTTATNPRRILSWVYVGRVCVSIALLIRATSPDPFPVSLTSAALLIAIAIAVSLASFIRSHRGSLPLPASFLYAQGAFDSIFLTAVVYITGGHLSIFTPAYILVITSGALLLPIWGGAVLGWLTSGLYLGIALSGVGWADPGVLLQGALFAIIAVVTGYLADRLRQAGQALGQVETQLRRLQLDTDDILDTIGTGIITVDSQGRLAYLNPAAVEILAIDPADWLDLPIIEELDRLAPGLGAVIHRTATTGTPIGRFETDPGAAGGSVLGVSTTLLERVGDENQPVTAIFQDITEKIRAEGLRRRAERLEAVAELSASLAHEIKNPLASIRSAVEQIASSRVDAEDARTLGTLIIRESDRLSRLLGEFIDFARVKVTAPQPLDLGELISRVVDVVRAHPDSSENNIHVHFDPPDTPVLIQGAEDVLHQAVLNLGLNAVQWSQPGGQVDFALGEVKSDLLSPSLGAFRLVRLEVRDSGPGVPEEIRDQIFDPFFTRRKGGSGLGLALVQRAVEAHGGAIFVDSAGANQPGATFSLYLPALPPSEEAARAPVSIGRTEK